MNPTLLSLYCIQSKWQGNKAKVTGRKGSQTQNLDLGKNILDIYDVHKLRQLNLNMSS